MQKGVIRTLSVWLLVGNGNKRKVKNMKCPRCGFQQPDDLFCASCGVNISRYQRQKRSKNALIGILISGLILATGIAFFLLRGPTLAPEPETLAPEPETLAPEPETTAPRILRQKPTPIERSTLKKPRRSKGSRQSRKPRQGKGAGASSKSGPDPPFPELTEENGTQKPEKVLFEETTGKTANDWFNEGVRLSNDSPEEINCYQQALKLDPTLAVAHYNLGVIYHSQENDEPAIKHFRNFLRYASDSEIKELPVENYYPLEKIAETSEGTEEAGVAEEELEEEVESEEEEEAAEEGETGAEGETVEEETE